jgi:hypothetical protein
MLDTLLSEQDGYFNPSTPPGVANRLGVMVRVRQYSASSDMAAIIAQG